jgi:hypothetical protein
MQSVQKLVGTPLKAVAIAVVLVLLGRVPAMAVPPTTTGSGGLTIDNNYCDGANGFVKLDRPEYDVIQNGLIHLNIEPNFSICTAGDPALLDTRCSSDANCTLNGTCTGATKKCNGGTNDQKTCNDPGDCPGGSCSNTCATGTNIGSVCSGASDCSIAGSCDLALECDPSSNSNNAITIQGHTGVACTSDFDCSGGTTCDTSSRCEGGSKDGSICTSDPDCIGGGACKVVNLCQFSDPVTGTAGTAHLCDGGGNDLSACSDDNNCPGGSCVTVGKIDACYTTRDTSCGDAQVVYCGTKLGNIDNPAKSAVRVTAILETTDAQGNELDTAAACTPPSTCQNTVGSLCCGLSQGAYGAPNSIATSLGTGGNLDFCANTNLGFIPAGRCDNCKVFAGDPNATTIGIHGTRAVTIGPKSGGTDQSFPTDLATLENYLPAGGTPGKFKTSLVSTDTHYYQGCGSGQGKIPDCTTGQTTSKGEGGGALAGQDMACGLNSFLSDCTPPFGGGSFTTAGFDNFKLPGAGTLVCTKRAGADAVLGTGDDICQAFLFPTCVAGLTVKQVKACADGQLANGTNTCGCSASALTQALDNINDEFESCGQVIDCGGQSTAGVFACP